jgi:hypothetical protein
MNDTINPDNTSDSKLINEQAANEIQNQPSDTSKTLGFIIGFFGIYFLVIGLFSLLAFLVLENSDLGLESMSDKDIYALVLIINSIFISLTAIFIGYKLIKRLDIGRKIFNVFTAVIILISIAQNAYNQHIIAKSFSNMPAELAAAARGSESSASYTVFILPAVLLVLGFILNWGKIMAWLKR